tara:strand:+ start:229 stop:1185 length:957 start_codon:yes stop_codon:yes gene_type:complete
MDKETHKKLTANFPKSVVKKAPQGKYGDYVPHHIYTKRLVDVVGGKYNFTYDIIRDKDNAVVGAKCTLEIDDLGTVQEVGDVDRHALARNLTESEILKLAVSDGIKRCCMRFGIGLELWTGDTTEEEHYAGVVQSVPEPPKKKPVAQEITKSPSSLTEPQLKEMVFSMCNEDKDFAKKCYETSMTRFKMDKSISDNVGDWSNDNVDKFLKLVEDYVNKFKNEFEKRAGNSEVVNTIIETLGNVQEKESEEDMSDIPEGKWMEDPISEGQKNFIKSLIEQAIDSGLDELGAEAKSYLNSGKATKGNASEMIDKLKSALS